MCITRLVRNQCQKVPSGGIIVGYFLRSCNDFSSAESSGPGYLGAVFGRLDPWEGGLNLVGFSRAKGLKPGLGEALFEARRMVWKVVDGAGRRARHMRPL
jgi:hypothetical protein